MPETKKREPKTRIKKIMKILAVALSVFTAAANMFGCTDNGDDSSEDPQVCEHTFVPMDSVSNRPADYGVEGRQYMVCSKCGFSMLETIPALSLNAAEDAPDYFPLLAEYTLLAEYNPKPMSYEEFAGLFLPSAWSFTVVPDEGGDGGEDGESEPMLSSGSYIMRFESAYEGYESAETTIKIVVG